MLGEALSHSSLASQESASISAQAPLLRSLLERFPPVRTAAFPDYRLLCLPLSAPAHGKIDAVVPVLSADRRLIILRRELPLDQLISDYWTHLLAEHIDRIRAFPLGAAPGQQELMMLKRGNDLLKHFSSTEESIRFIQSLAVNRTLPAIVGQIVNQLIRKKELTIDSYYAHEAIAEWHSKREEALALFFQNSDSVLPADTMFTRVMNTFGPKSGIFRRIAQLPLKEWSELERRDLGSIFSQFPFFSNDLLESIGKGLSRPESLLSDPTNFLSRKIGLPSFGIRRLKQRELLFRLNGDLREQNGAEGVSKQRVIELARELDSSRLPCAISEQNKVFNLMRVIREIALQDQALAKEIIKKSLPLSKEDHEFCRHEGLYSSHHHHAFRENMRHFVEACEDQLVTPLVRIRVAAGLHPAAVCIETNRRIARHLLFTSRSMRQICSAKRDWEGHGARTVSLQQHRINQERFPDIAHFLKAPFKESPDVVANWMTNGSDLIEEGIEMRHCVGSGGYTRSCFTGEYFIASLRLNNKRLSTLHLALDNARKEVRIVQHTGPRNTSPPAASATLARSIVSHLNDPENGVQWEEHARAHERRKALLELPFKSPAEINDEEFYNLRFRIWKRWISPKYQDRESLERAIIGLTAR